MKCTNCQSVLLDNARFCHSCGHKVATKPVQCPSCTAINSSGAKFCFECGCALASNLKYSAQSYIVKHPLNFEKTGELKDQISVHFFAALKQRITAEHDVKQYQKYVAQFYDSNFDRRFQLRAAQIAEEAYTIHCRQDELILIDVDNLLERSFDDLLDYFIIMHCKSINEIDIPEAILKYQSLEKKDININEMIFDYLDINQEKKEKFYLNFLAVPANKIKNAAQSFLFADKKEMVYLLCDQTVFGSCKEGFAITERGLYWKAHFNKAAAVHYENILQIEKENDWININGKYFHVNPSFNFKMMKLLKKLSKLF